MWGSSLKYLMYFYKFRCEGYFTLRRLKSTDGGEVWGVARYQARQSSPLRAANIMRRQTRWCEGAEKISLKPHYTTGHRPSPVQHNEAGNSEFSTERRLTLYRFRLEIEEKQTETERGIKDKVILNLLVATVFFSVCLLQTAYCVFPFIAHRNSSISFIFN